MEAELVLQEPLWSTFRDKRENSAALGALAQTPV